MFPGLGGMNPAQMKSMMRQFGIKSEDIAASKVTIEADGKKIIIENPQVTAILLQGKRTYTVMGNEREERAAVALEIPDSDVEMVAEQAKVAKEKARAALEETKGDIAEAIEKLSG